MFFILFLLLSNLFIYELDAKIQINRLIALNNPWSITFIDKDNLLITEKRKYKII